MKKRKNINWFNYFIELLIVIIGISVAFWLNDMSSKNRNEQEKLTYLSDIRNDLKTDSLRLSRSIRSNELKIKNLNRTLELIEKSAPIDSILPNIVTIGSYDFFDPDNYTLSSLIQSGDLKLIDSKKTKKELLRLIKVYKTIDTMQKNFLQALDDGFFPMLLSRVDMIKFEPIDPDFFYGIRIKNYCVFTITEASQQVQTYKYAKNQIEKVKKEIDLDLNEH